ncbi:FecR domain-containing protein [Paenibacillus sp. S-38]|uniref:FecR family protein n=1 Tax=Paenibacillus sp. S-38 TaxID=3416710 RepID=UPI003CF5E0ED
MGEREKGRSGPRRLPAVLALALLFTLLASFGPALRAEAASERAAYVAEVSGRVTYKKAGGSKTFQVYKDLNLNQGDYLYTAADSYVILKVGANEVQFTVAANTEIYIADLTEGNGKTTRVQSWAGSLWAKVKSLVSSEDEVELETPTAVMGVRGTHFAVLVDPATGHSVMLVGSGRVNTETVQSQTDGTQEVKSAMVYPSQQIALDPDGVSGDIRTHVEYVDVQGLVKMASPKVLEAILRNVPDIQKENEAMKKKLQEQFEQGMSRPHPQSILRVENADDLSKVQQNFDAFVSQIAKEAVNQNKIDKKLIDEVNREISDPAKKLDIDNPPPLDKTAGLDPAILEAKKRELQEQNEALREEEKRMQEAETAFEAVRRQMEAKAKELQEANRKAELEQQQKAQELLLSQLAEKERAAFEENRKKNASGSGTPVVEPVPDTSSGSDGSSGGGSTALPQVKLTQAASAEPGIVRLSLQMEGFTEELPFYAVEAHASMAAGKLNYDGTADGKLEDKPGTVFDGEQTAEVLRQADGSGLSELIYTGTLFQGSGREAPAPVKLNGSRVTLVELPLRTEGMKPGETTQVELFYFKVLDASGNMVYELKTPITLTVTAP